MGMLERNEPAHGLRLRTADAWNIHYRQPLAHSERVLYYLAKRYRANPCLAKACPPRVGSGRTPKVHLIPIRQPSNRGPDSKSGTFPFSPRLDLF